MPVKPVVPPSPAVREARDKAITALFDLLRHTLSNHYEVSNANEGGKPSVNVTVPVYGTNRSITICFWRDHNAIVGLKAPSVHRAVPMEFDPATGVLTGPDGTGGVDVLMTVFNSIAGPYVERPKPQKPVGRVLLKSRKH